MDPTQPIHIDLNRATATGFCSIRLPDDVILNKGDTIYVADQDTDVYEATVLRTHPAREVEIRIHYHRVTPRDTSR